MRINSKQISSEGPDVQQTSPAVKKFILGAVIFVLATTAGFIIAPIEVRFISLLTNNSTLIGLTYAIGALVFAILSVYLGRLSDRIGRTKIVTLGCGLGIIFPLLYASTYNVLQYMGVKFLWAFASVATGPVFMAYLQDIIKNEKKKGYYFGVMFSASAVTGAAAQFIGGYTSDVLGIKFPFFIMAAVFALSALFAFFSLDLKEKPVRKKTSDKGPLYGLKLIFTRPILIFYFIENTAYSMNWGIKGLLWPLIIFGMTRSDTMTGSVFATMGIVAFCVLPFTGKLVDRIGAIKTAFISMVVLGVSGVFLALTGHLWVFWIAAGFFAIGESLNGPMQAVLLTENVPSSYRGEILGLDAVLDNTLGTLSPFIAGVLLNIFSPQGVLGFYIGAIWVALIGCGIIYRLKIID